MEDHNCLKNSYVKVQRMPSRRIKELKKFRKLLLQGQCPPVEVRLIDELKGLGVFALDEIKPYTIICEYLGNVMTTFDIDR